MSLATMRYLAFLRKLISFGFTQKKRDLCSVSESVGINYAIFYYKKNKSRIL